jgi:hypothetical protein
MKQIRKKFAIQITFVVLVGVFLWIGSNPSRRVQQIVPRKPFETVLKLLGEPLNEPIAVHPYHILGFAL